MVVKRRKYSDEFKLEAVVIDLFNRMVVGWSMGNRITQELALSDICLRQSIRI